MSAGAIPARVGSLRLRTATQLAEKAIDDIAGRVRRDYAVTVDPAGVVWIDYPANAVPAEILMTVNRQSDPDALADVIRYEKEIRA